MNTRFNLFMLTIGTLLAGCAQQAPKPPVAEVADKKPMLIEPFRFHKMIEVSPGDDFDVFEVDGAGGPGGFRGGQPVQQPGDGDALRSPGWCEAGLGA